MMQAIQYGQPATGSWLITLRNGATWGTQCWSFAAGRLGTQQGHSQIGFGECKSILLTPCMTFILATMATLFMSPLGDDRGGWGKRVTGTHRIGHFFPLNYQSVPLLSHLLVSIHMGHKYLHIFAHSERSIQIFVINFPQISLSSVFQSYSFLTIQPNHWP